MDFEILRIHNRMKGLPEPEPVVVVPTFPLLNVPDEELDEAGKVEKKKQKTQKGFWEAREKMKKEKEAAEKKKREAIEADDARRLANPEKWLKEHRLARKQLVAKMNSKVALKQSFKDRRSAASKDRLRIVAGLAKEATEHPNRKRRHGPDG